jgi:hypothetical protein
MRARRFEECGHAVQFTGLRIKMLGLSIGRHLSRFKPWQGPFRLNLATLLVTNSSEKSQKVFASFSAMQMKIHFREPRFPYIKYLEEEMLPWRPET